MADHALAAADTGAFEDAPPSAWQALDVLDGRGGEQASALDPLVTMAAELHDRGAGEDVWEPFRSEALERLGKQHDRRWARPRLLEGGGMKQISGPPLQVGRWAGLDREAVLVARTQGDENDYCSALSVYDRLRRPAPINNIWRKVVADMITQRAQALGP